MSNKSTAAAAAKSKETAITKTPKTVKKENELSPMFIEAEKAFERLAEMTSKIGHRAYEFFLKRGGEFGREFEDWFKAESEILRPVPVEITEANGNINVRAAVPGFKPEEIEVSVKGDQLILSGETEMKEKREDENTIYSEWRSNRFCRQFTLSSEVDADKVQANLKDGILNLTMPKIPMREPKQIEVQAE